MPDIYAFDPGRVSGYAVFTEYGNGVWWLDRYGTIAAAKADAKNADAILMAHWDWLNSEHISEEAVYKRPFDIAMEAPIQVRSLPTDSSADEARGVIRLYAVLTGDPPVSYKPPTIKALLTGKAGANKKEVAAAVSKLFGIKRFAADHIPDAIAVGVTHIHKVYGVPVSAFQVEEAA